MGSIGAPEIILIILALVLLFGAKKLPELARGSGRALRIFKAETKGLGDEDDDKREEQKQIEAQRSAEAARPVEHQAETPAEPHRTEPER
jgi:sec-independent protein translocase protein TatA